MTTKCDIVRDMVAATTCGLCTSKACKATADCPDGQVCQGGTCVGRPALCPPGLSAAVCAIPEAANVRMALFANRYSPASAFAKGANKAERTLEERDYVTAIQKAELDLAAAYPGAPSPATNISWPDMEKCLWTKGGSKAGAYNNVYFRRNDLASFGMKPRYPVGGAAAKGVVWRQDASPLPTAVDYVANPDLAVILVFVFLVIVFAALIYAAYKRKKRANAEASFVKDAERRALEENDPYQGTKFESYPDPTAKCRAYVEAMEAQGYSMGYYRQQCGLPPKNG